jgi:hypothetical protein
MSTSASLLIAQPEVVAELRLGLLREYVSSNVAELYAVVDEVEDDLASAEPNLEGKRERFHAATRALQQRYLLHQKVGFPDQPLAEQTLEGKATCALAVSVLANQRDNYITCLGRHEVADRERTKLLATVRLLTAFLRHAQEEKPLPVAASSEDGS